VGNDAIEADTTPIMRSEKAMYATPGGQEARLQEMGALGLDAMAIPRGRDKRAALLGAVLVVAAVVACVAVSLVVRPASARVVAHARFPITDLGTLQGGHRSYAFDINDRGQVVGYSETASGLYRAFVWKKGKMTALTLKGTPEETESNARDLNDRGQIVGKWTVYDSHEPHASLWQRGKRVDLGTLRGGTVSSADGINERGQVVGGSEVASGYTHAVLWGKRVS
jgi:probable HAF family extracellular repeat protein